MIRLVHFICWQKGTLNCCPPACWKKDRERERVVRNGKKAHIHWMQKKLLAFFSCCYLPFRSCPAIIINNAFHGIHKKRNAKQVKDERKLILFRAIAGIFIFGFYAHTEWEWDWVKKLKNKRFRWSSKSQSNKNLLIRFDLDDEVATFFHVCLFSFSLFF